METYYISFDFETEGEPPNVYIANRDSGPLLQVFEDPTSPLGKSVEIEPGVLDWEGMFSFETEDWEPGPIAKRILEMMNRDNIGADEADQGL